MARACVIFGLPRSFDCSDAATKITAIFFMNAASFCARDSSSVRVVCVKCRGYCHGDR